MKDKKRFMIIILLCLGIILPISLNISNFHLSGYEILSKYPLLSFVIPLIAWVFLLKIFLKNYKNK